MTYGGGLLAFGPALNTGILALERVVSLRFFSTVFSALHWVCISLAWRLLALKPFEAYGRVFAFYLNRMMIWDMTRSQMVAVSDRLGGY